MARHVPFNIALTLLLALPLAAADVAESDRGVAGVKKVIEMLEAMAAKTKKERDEEEVAMANYTKWCSMRTDHLNKDIKSNQAEMESLSAEIGVLQTDVQGLAEAAQQLNVQIGNYEADSAKAKAQREKDRTAFLAESKDFAESVDALERAITLLETQAYDRKAAAAAKGKAASLLQLSASAEVAKLPFKARSIVSAFLGMAEGDNQAPEADVYKFQGGGIVQMLKNLRDEFKSKLGESQKAEMKNELAYKLLSQDLAASVASAKVEIQDKTQESARKSQKAAEDKKQLTGTTAVEAENQKTLTGVTAECEQKKTEYEEKQSVRAEEMEAIQKAVEILKSPEVTGNGEKYLRLSQASRQAVGTVLMQFGNLRSSSSERIEAVRGELQDFLETEGRRLRSQRLSLLAQSVVAGPFDKVKGLIEQMITRLNDEAKAEADTKSFCDTELGKSKVSRTQLTEKVSGLKAATEDGKAKILALTKSVAELQKELAELTATRAKSAELREAEHAKNLAIVEDAQKAQEAVLKATTVLKDFYSKKPPAALLQTASSTGKHWRQMQNEDDDAFLEVGETETQAEAEMEQESGVLALLEVIQSDFATLEADTKAAEANGKRTFESEETEAKKNKAVKEKQVEMDSGDKVAAESKLERDTEELKTTQDQLQAAEHYFEKLQPQCGNKGVSYEERKKARQQEMESLKQAIEILAAPAA